MISDITTIGGLRIALTRPSFWAAMAALEDLGYVIKREEVVGDYDSKLTLHLFKITRAGLEAL